MRFPRSKISEMDSRDLLRERAFSGRGLQEAGKGKKIKMEEAAVSWKLASVWSHGISIAQTAAEFIPS